MKSIVISIRLPEKIVRRLKKMGKPSEIIKNIIIQRLYEEKKKTIEEIKKIKVREGESKVDVVKLIREDRDVLH